MKNTVFFECIYFLFFTYSSILINEDKLYMNQVLWLDLLKSMWIVFSVIEGLISPLLVQVQLILP